MRGKNFLVAGGTGIVGTNLTKRLVDMGADVRATYFSKKPLSFSERYERYDFTELEDCLKATKDMDYVFICAAAEIGGAKVMKERPVSQILPNLRIHASLLEACHINRVEKVVCISSPTVYQEVFHPIQEDELDLNVPPYPLYLGIGWVKRYYEQLARFFHVRYGLKVAIVRPCGIYGPHDRFDLEQSHVLPALIMRALQKQDPYIVWGNGHDVRDFIYVGDLVDDLLEILDKYCVGDPVNSCTGSTLTIRDAVEVILEVCGHHVRPQYDESKPRAIPYRVLSPAKLEALLGRRVRTPFRDGIKKTVEWYLASRNRGQ